jgi:hypothetical protein
MVKARKNIQLPKKVTLGPFTCELLLIEHDLAYEVSEAQGASVFKVPYKAYFDKSIIELGGPDAVNVVIHEMLHVGFYQYNLKDKEEETVVNSFGNFMTELLSRSELSAWIKDNT